MSGVAGILLSVLGFTSVVDKNRIDSMHPVFPASPTGHAH